MRKKLAWEALLLLNSFIIDVFFVLFREAKAHVTQASPILAV